MVVVGEDLLSYPFIRGPAKFGRPIPCHLCEVLRVRGWRFSGRYGSEKVMILERDIMEEERRSFANRGFKGSFQALGKRIEQITLLKS